VQQLHVPGDPSSSGTTGHIQQLHKTNHEIRKDRTCLLDCKIGAFVACQGFGVR